MRMSRRLLSMLKCVLHAICMTEHKCQFDIQQSGSGAWCYDATTWDFAPFPRLFSPYNYFVLHTRHMIRDSHAPVSRKMMILIRNTFSFEIVFASDALRLIICVPCLMFLFITFSHLPSWGILNIFYCKYGRVWK